MVQESATPHSQPAFIRHPYRHASRHAPLNPFSTSNKHLSVLPFHDTSNSDSTRHLSPWSVLGEALNLEHVDGARMGAEESTGSGRVEVEMMDGLPFSAQPGSIKLENEDGLLPAPQQVSWAGLDRGR
jgi:hypothetical protein